MSADNGYIIRLHPKGGFTPVHYFASDDSYPPVTGHHKSYRTVEEAVASVMDDWTEYGVTLHTEIPDGAK